MKIKFNSDYDLSLKELRNDKQKLFLPPPQK